MPTRVDALREALTAALQPQLLEIDDDSHRHAGHAGARGGGGHYKVRIVSERFSGLSPLARHRRVHEILAELMQRDIHALALETRTPEEAAARTR